MSKQFSILTILFLLFVTTSGFSKIYSVIDYGAKGDGFTSDTRAIQATIDACSKNGGGRIYFAPGTYLSGTIYIKNGVELNLEHGATLLGSTKEEDYPITICDFRSYTDKYVVRSLIYAEKAQHISITGRGTIDGRGAAFKDRRSKEDPYKRRPYLIRMIECTDIAVQDITIKNSPMWVQHYLACDDVLIDGITVRSRVSGNNDGIDIDSCHRVRIANCDIRSGDDAIVLKASSNRSCRDVAVTNCILSSDANGFKLGTESNGGFQNITMSNCIIYDTRKLGIALEMVDGGLLERVTVNNVSIDNCGAAIFVRLGNRARPYLVRKTDQQKESFADKKNIERPGVGTLRQVIISNVVASNIGKYGCSITGIPGHNVTDVTLDNIRIEFIGGGSRDLVEKPVPEKEKKYPGINLFGEFPSYGFFTRHVRDIKFSNIKLELKEADARPAMIFDQVEDLDLFDVDGDIFPSALSLLWMKSVNGAMVHACRPTRQMATFLKVDNSKNISIFNNDFKNAQKPVILNSAMNKKELYYQNNR